MAKDMGLDNRLGQIIESILEDANEDLNLERKLCR